MKVSTWHNIICLHDMSLKLYMFFFLLLFSFYLFKHSLFENIFCIFLLTENVIAIWASLPDELYELCVSVLLTFYVLPNIPQAILLDTILVSCDIWLMILDANILAYGTVNIRRHIIKGVKFKTMHWQTLKYNVI